MQIGRPRPRKLAAVLALPLLSLCALAPGSARAVEKSFKCSSKFEATVHQGPHKGLAVVGRLDLDVTGHRVEGVMNLDAGLAVAVTGQVDDRAANLIFRLSDTDFIYGTGTLMNGIEKCDGVWGGPLVGPDSADSGSWAGFFGGGGGPSCPTPQILGPSFQSGKIFMNAPGSCIQLPAILQMRDPSSGAQVGAFSLRFDETATRLVAANAGQAMPAGSCRTLTVIDAQNRTSAAVNLCR